MTFQPSQLLESYDRIYRTLLRCTKDRHIAEDLAQETYLRAFRHVRARGPPRRPEPWLSSIARNVAADYFNRRRGESSVEEPVADERNDPLEVAIRTDEEEQLRTARGYLPLTDQDAIDHFYWYGESYEQISLGRGTSRSATKSRLWRARQRLKELLKSPYID